MFTLQFLTFFSFFFNDTATTEIYTLSLHDALPIWNDQCPTRSSTARSSGSNRSPGDSTTSPSTSSSHSTRPSASSTRQSDRKSTRLNSSHGYISYAVFCLKKKKKKKKR